MMHLNIVSAQSIKLMGCIQSLILLLIFNPYPQLGIISTFMVFKLIKKNTRWIENFYKCKTTKLQ